MMQSAYDTSTRELFDANAQTYDRINTVISLGMDALWRRWVIQQAIAGEESARVFDAFAGTGRVGVAAAARGARVTLADASLSMLDVARRRAAKHGVEVRYATADLADPSIAPLGHHFDAVTVAFGVRYLDDPVAVLRRLGRMLRPGGRLVLLDFCVPRPGPVASAAGCYFFCALPTIAGLLSGDRALYDKLTETTRALGGPDRLPELAKAAGLEVSEVRTMGFGLVIGVVARRGIL